MTIREFVIFGVGRLIPDRVWIQIKYRHIFKKFCDLKNPQTFNEKLQWLKLYERRPDYTTMADKYKVKEYVSNRISEEYVVPILGGPWECFEDIDFDKLPNQFVLKTNHDCGGVVVCKDKNTFDRIKAKKKLSAHLKNNYYLRFREWPYKKISPLIFAEKYIEDESGEELRDYKFFCFNGEPKLMYIATDRTSETEETKFDFFDMDFNHLPFTNGHPNASVIPNRPTCFEVMKELAAKLSKGIPHVRVDFYEANGNVYFGEFTFFHFSGLVPFNPEEWDNRIGKWITLPERKKK